MSDYRDDPFKILGVSREATEKEIKTSYRKLALKHHPDRQSNDKDRAEAQDKFAKIANAYEVLTDPELRRQYEESLREEKRSTPVPNMIGSIEIARMLNESRTRNR